MPDFVGRFRALSRRARTIVACGALGLVAAIAFLVFVERDTRVAVFATPLAPEQVAEVSDRLAAWNVPFVALPDNVRVEERRRNDVLLRLALAHVPHAHVPSTIETLAKASPLTPQSVLEAQQRAGLAGDLESALRGIAGISDARVIVAPGTAGTFADEASHDATASVRLSLDPGASLSRETLEAIRAFVAGGVPGLAAERVALLDDRGLALDDAGDAGSGDARGLEASLQSALDLAVGAGATIVRVRIAYDPRERETRAIVRKPLGSRPIGATGHAETYRSSTKTYVKNDTNVDGGSEVDDERVDTPGGRLARTSVAIAVDAARGLDARKIRSLAIGTLGLDPSRGDAVSVETIAFAHPSIATTPAYAVAIGVLATCLPAALIAVAIATGARFGAKPLALSTVALVRALAVRRTVRAAASFPPSQVRGALRDEPPHTAAAIISALPAATATAVLEMYPAEERAAIVRRMSRIASPAVPDYETVLRRG